MAASRLANRSNGNGVSLVIDSVIDVRRWLAHAVISVVALAVANIVTPRVAKAQGGRIAVHVVADTVPVTNALVRAAAITTRTNHQGVATVAVAPGVVSIVVTKIGFRPDSAVLTVVPGLDTSLAIQLAEQPPIVAPVFVTS